MHLPVEFDINPQTMQATQLWQYGADLGDDRLFTPYLGDADKLPVTGNILINFSSISDTGTSSYFTEIVEVTHDDQKDVVFKVVLDANNVYRTARLSSLYH